MATSATKLQEEEIFKELCLSNGLTQGRLDNGEGQEVTILEMFFSGYPKIIGMENFPNLSKLCLMGQDISKIEGLSFVPNLKELWIAECSLKRIEGLEICKSLRKLYLYSNEIRKIENIDHLAFLEVLWLADNEITSMEGLSSLIRLRELNLADNGIEKIGVTLKGLNHLEKLELSGNQIYSFKDLTNLIQLPALQHLGLKSPDYAPNPVCLLCNYSTHVLYHLPGLVKLDTYDVSSKALRELSETTVQKKKMYYNMRVKTLRRNLGEMLGKLGEVRQAYVNGPHEKIRVLFDTIKELEREVDIFSQSKENDTTHENQEIDKEAQLIKNEEERLHLKKLQAKVSVVNERVKRWEKKIEEVDYYHTEASDRMHNVTEVNIGRLMTELETGGNVRFEDGKPADLWFTSCHDLILSRFCATDYRDFGILGVKVNRITRVHNRILKSRFEESMADMTEDEDNYFSSSRNSAHKKNLEYLFWIWDPDLPSGGNEPYRVLEEGFMESHLYKQLGKDGAVPLTNSLSLAEWPRITYFKKHAENNEYWDTCPFRQGMLIVTKVYIGRSVESSDNKPVYKTNFLDADSVFRPRKHDVHNLKKSSNNSETSTSSRGVSLGTQKCECTTRQCEWFIFDRDLVLPEYVIDFEYITRVKPRSVFASHTDSLLESKDYVKPICGLDLGQSDDDVLSMLPKIKPRPRLITLSEELILKLCKARTLSSITTLNLHGNSLTKLKVVQSLVSLKKLIISFNELTKLDDLTQMNLEYLDASFNKINTLDGMKHMSKLKHLDLSWNKLQNTREDISILRKHTPALQTLDLRYNDWQKPEGLRLRAIGRIKTLNTLNGAPVTEIEAASALRMAAGSRISQLSILTHSRTDTSHPRTLTLGPTALLLLDNSRNKPARLGEQDNQWYAKVTMLNLDGQHISKISNLERLENLKWASFSDNDITKIEGLDGCLHLEELSLVKNCISKLENLSKLTKLRRLNLSHNYLTTIEGGGLDRLPHLSYLSIESNCISSLAGLQRIPALIELYIGNNQVSNIRDIFYLKALSNLMILDLYGNSVVSSDNYRLFVIYHLKSLKALDGKAIETVEGNQAKDVFGGRLTSDFVAEKISHSNFADVRELDVPNQYIRTVDLGTGDLFLNLRSVNLEHNNMTSFSGLIYLVNLRVLCLNHNHIECIVPKTKPPINKSKLTGIQAGVTGSNVKTMELYQADCFTPVLENLEVLHLGYNGIKDMAALQLSRLVALKALFLQGNEISKVDGLEGLQDLRELVLDRNKIKSVSEYSFMNQWNLQELHLEENRVKELNGFSVLENLHRLYLGTNRIQDIAELEKLESLPNLIELSVVGNAVARRLLHRPMLVFRMPQLVLIDGIQVTEEEKAKAELYFMEQQVSNQTPPQGLAVETTLPGIGQYKAQMPVKVTNVQLMSQSVDRSWPGLHHYHDDLLQQELQRGLQLLGNIGAAGAVGRRRGPARNDPPQTLSNKNGNVSYYGGGNHNNQRGGSHPTGDYFGQTDSNNRYQNNNMNKGARR